LLFDVLKRAYQHRAITLGEADWRTLKSLENLVGLLYEQGRWKETETLCLQLLAATEASSGPESAAAVSVTSILAAILAETGKLDEAERLNLRADGFLA
jgi:hypothetical protein